MKTPWFKFYPADWRSDEQLRMCSIAARGLWVEMLCLMHKAKPYGHLLINGEAPTDAQLAVQAGMPCEQVTGLISELEAAGVFSRTAKGAIYSRKLVRDEKKSNIAKKNGKDGGNPTLCNGKEIPASDNPRVKPPDKGKDKPHIPEARIQKPEINNYYDFDFSGDGFEGEVIRLDPAGVKELFQRYWSGDEHSFREWLTNRDQWYQTQSYSLYQNDKWLHQTIKRLRTLASKKQADGFQKLGDIKC